MDMTANDPIALRRSCLIVAFTVTLLPAPAVAGPSPAQACQAGKNKEAGKYGTCRQNAEAKLATTGDATKYATALAKCLEKYRKAWPKLEAKATKKGAVCLSMGDETSIQGITDAHTAAIAALLAGGTPGDCSTQLASCTADLAACEAGSGPQGQRLQTGQTLCYDAAGATTGCAATGQDGELQRGLTRAYVDNGDGTVTDTRTGLTWEKHADDGSIHDKDTQYAWVDAFPKIASLNGGGGFAGHTDWRLPNANELHSLVDYGRFSPSVDPVFNTACAPGCTVLTCSCTKTGDHWSSTSFLNLATQAWFVSLDSGTVSRGVKTSLDFVRAVRGGS
jgi:hypothetical protein